MSAGPLYRKDTWMLIARVNTSTVRRPQLQNSHTSLPNHDDRLMLRILRVVQFLDPDGGSASIYAGCNYASSSGNTYQVLPIYSTSAEGRLLGQGQLGCSVWIRFVTFFGLRLVDEVP